METQNFRQTLLVAQTPKDVFNAILDVHSWWSGYYDEEFEGAAEKLHDEFSFRAGDGAHYSKQKLVEVIPNQKVVWLITDSQLTFIEKTDEWIGTKVIFEISPKGDKTQLVFTHEGLTPESECFESCAPAWTQYLHHKLMPILNTNRTERIH